MRLEREAREVRLFTVATVNPPSVAVPVKAGLAKGARVVRLLSVARVNPPSVGVPVNAGLAKGANPDILGI